MNPNKVWIVIKDYLDGKSMPRVAFATEEEARAHVANGISPERHRVMSVQLCGQGFPSRSDLNAG